MRVISYIKDKGLKHAIHVVWAYKLQHIINNILNLFFCKKNLLNIIIIESHNDFDCNGGALYNYLIEKNYNKKYKIVWMLKNDFREKLPKNVYAFNLFKPSIRKSYYINRAKFFLADCCITPKMRMDQISIYQGHGLFSLKNVKGLLNVDKSVDFVLSSSPNCDEIIRNQFSLYPEQKIIHEGAPCLDILYEENVNEITKITTRRYDKIILWMPTFRKGGGYKRNDSEIEYPFGVPLIEDANMFEEIDRILQHNNILLLIKFHPMQDLTQVTKLGRKNNIIIITGDDVKKKGINTYALLRNTDALISDYSSIAFQYILLDKPIAFMLNDLKSYKLGLSVENPEKFIVGQKIFSIDDLKQFIEDINNGNDLYKIEREKLKNWLYTYQDGNSSERIVRFLKL